MRQQKNLLPRDSSSETRSKDDNIVLRTSNCDASIVHTYSCLDVANGPEAEDIDQYIAAITHHHRSYVGHSEISIDPKRIQYPSIPSC